MTFRQQFDTEPVILRYVRKAQTAIRISPAIVYMTKQVSSDMDSAGRPTFEITDAMVQAGLDVYAELAWHDSDSPGSPREVVTQILLRGLACGKPLAITDQEKEDEVLKRMLKTPPKPHKREKRKSARKGQERKH